MMYSGVQKSETTKIILDFFIFKIQHYFCLNVSKRVIGRANCFVQEVYYTYCCISCTPSQSLLITRGLK